MARERSEARVQEKVEEFSGLQTGLDPARLVSLAIPARLFDAMRAPIERAMSLDDAPPPGQPPLPFTIVSGQ